MKWESINLWSKHLFGVCSTGAWTIRGEEGARGQTQPPIEDGPIRQERSERSQSARQRPVNHRGRPRWATLKGLNRQVLPDSSAIGDEWGRAWSVPEDATISPLRLHPRAPEGTIFPE